MHPSLRLVRSRWPALTVWRMNVSDVPTTPVDFSVPEDALIVRPGAEVEVRIVPPGGAAFVTALAAGGTLLSAAETAQAADAAVRPRREHRRPVRRGGPLPNPPKRDLLMTVGHGAHRLRASAAGRVS